MSPIVRNCENNLGILETKVAKILLSKEFLDQLMPETRKAHTQQLGQPVEKYLRHSLIQNLEDLSTI